MELSSEAQNVRVKPYKKDFTYSYTEGVFPTIELIDYAPETVLRIIVSSKSANNSGRSTSQREMLRFQYSFYRR